MAITSYKEWLEEAAETRGTVWEDPSLWAAFEAQEHSELSDQEIIDRSARASLAWMLDTRFKDED